MQKAWMKRRTGEERQVGPTRARSFRIRPDFRRPSALFGGRNGRKWSRRSRTRHSMAPERALAVALMMASEVMVAELVASIPRTLCFWRIFRVVSLIAE